MFGDAQTADRKTTGLEVQFQPHHDAPGIRSGRVRTEQGVDLIAVRVETSSCVHASELSVVKCIVHLQPILQPHFSFRRQIEILEHRNVPVIRSWQTEQVFGGIATTEDALEFMIAGASAVQVGTANFYDPSASMKVVDGLADYCRQNGLAGINELIGSVVVD